jgi:deazaflavin-dependent oxidoreductase (nitroreductase family)
MDQLGYRYPKRSLLRRAAVAPAAFRAVAWCLARVLPTLDGRLLKLTRGRISVSELVAGTPVITLTTRGARTGQARTSHLLGIPVADTVALIGSNFGQEATPSWVYNLLAEPRARVSYQSSLIGVIARPVSGSEYEQVFAAAALISPGYGAYRARLASRQLKVFVLEIDPDAPGERETFR